MKPRPVERIECPAYPTRRQVLEGAVVFFLPAVFGCGGQRTGESPDAAAPASAVRTVVAPIFEHGGGRGAIGCVVVSPPAFLSEEDGMQIIREELAKHGVKLGAGATLDDVTVPLRREEARLIDEPGGKKRVEQKIVEDTKHARPLKLDGTDPAKKVAVEFVSQKDYFQLGGTGSNSTVQDFDFKGVAESVAKQVKSQGKQRLYVGLFYDPAVGIMPPGDHGKPSPSTEPNWDKFEKKSRDEAKKLLRQQAADFVGWLKQQKVLQ